MMVGSIIIECLGRQNMTFEGSINHGWIYALMGVSKTELHYVMVYRGTVTNGVARIIHCPPPQISTYYYITL